MWCSDDYGRDPGGGIVNKDPGGWNDFVPDRGVGDNKASDCDISHREIYPRCLLVVYIQQGDK